jgi:cyclopropane fatty-acyl-phospholipid synthase-like methyltransferase
MSESNSLNSDIKSMKLYRHVDRVLTELQYLGKSEQETLSASELTPFDQLHYHGTESVDEAVRATGITAGSLVLEIGSGLGGPARHIAATAGAKVTALELQVDQNELASHLSARCGLAEKVAHVCGDFLTHEWSTGHFDVIVSWLALYHIPKRSVLLERCYNLLQKGGYFFTEDLYARKEFTDWERSELATELFANCLPVYDTYLQDLKTAGFELVSAEEMSDDWTAFTRERLAAYRAQKARHIDIHGEAVFIAMEHFYDVVVRHFAGGKLGGIRIVARKA